jgi:hypothetical protein
MSMRDATSLVIVLIILGVAFLATKDKVDAGKPALSTCRAFTALELEKEGLEGEWEICTTIRKVR